MAVREFNAELSAITQCVFPKSSDRDQLVMAMSHNIETALSDSNYTRDLLLEDIPTMWVYHVGIDNALVALLEISRDPRLKGVVKSASICPWDHSVILVESPQEIDFLARYAHEKADVHAITSIFCVPSRMAFMKPGTFVKMLSGTHAGEHAQIIGIDYRTSLVYVKLLPLTRFLWTLLGGKGKMPTNKYQRVDKDWLLAHNVPYLVKRAKIGMLMHHMLMWNDSFFSMTGCYVTGVRFASLSTSGPLDIEHCRLLHRATTFTESLIPDFLDVARQQLHLDAVSDTDLQHVPGSVMRQAVKDLYEGLTIDECDDPEFAIGFANDNA